MPPWPTGFFQGAATCTNARYLAAGSGAAASNVTLSLTHRDGWLVLPYMPIESRHRSFCPARHPGGVSAGSAHQAQPQQGITQTEGQPQQLAATTLPQLEKIKWQSTCTCKSTASRASPRTTSIRTGSR